jgi:hypothetical protein
MGQGYRMTRRMQAALPRADLPLPMPCTGRANTAVLSTSGPEPDPAITSSFDGVSSSDGPGEE